MQIVSKLLGLIIALCLLTFTTTLSQAADPTQTSVATSQTKAQTTIELVNVYAPATPPGARMAAIYLTIKNLASKQDDFLLEVSTELASTMIHSSTDVNGVSKMLHMDQLPVPANSEVKLQPGGTHIMLMGLSQPLKANSQFNATFTFKHAGAITTQVLVKGLE